MLPLFILSFIPLLSPFLSSTPRGPQKRLRGEKVRHRESPTMDRTRDRFTFAQGPLRRQRSTTGPTTTSRSTKGKRLSRGPSEDDATSGTHTPRGRRMRLDSYLASRSASRSSQRSASPSNGGPFSSSLPRRAMIRRWDGVKRTTTTWDGIRRVRFPRYCSTRTMLTFTGS